MTESATATASCPPGINPPARASTPQEDLFYYYISNPDEWVKDVIGATLDPWQTDVLKSIANDRYVAIRSGHGVGKSFIVACALLWFLCNHPFCKVICTAPTKEQLLDVIWAQCAALIRESRRLGGIVAWETQKIAVKKSPEEWFAIARTAEVRKLGKTGLAMAEGLQGRHAKSVFYILDEASGIDEAVMSTIDGSLTSADSYVLMTGNPTRSSGTFYDAFHSKTSLWKCFHVNAEDSTRVDKSWCRRMLQKYGSRDNPMYLIRVRGEFPPGQYNSLFDLISLENCINATLTAGSYEAYEIGVDVARYGGDSTVFALKHGSVIEDIEEYPQRSLMETVGRVIQLITKYRPIVVRIDTVGMGAGVFDRLVEQGYTECVSFESGSSPQDGKQFVNKRAEAYWHLKSLVEQGLIKLPRHADLIEQATSITYLVTSRGKVQIESKEDLRDRGVSSPDHLDAVVMAAYGKVPIDIRRRRHYFRNLNIIGR